jgi:hypothetical protein
VGSRTFRVGDGLTGRIDAVGVVLGSLGIAALAYAVGEGPTRLTSTPVAIVLPVGGRFPLVVVRCSTILIPSNLLFRVRRCGRRRYERVASAVGLGAAVVAGCLPGMGYSH